MAVVTMNESSQIKEMPSPLGIPPTADSLDDIFVAPTTAADGVQFKYTGRDFLTVKNTDGATSYYFTLVSVADEINRTGDVQYTLAAGESATFAVPSKGFKDSNGNILVTMENVAVEIAVNRSKNLNGA